VTARSPNRTAPTLSYRRPGPTGPPRALRASQARGVLVRAANALSRPARQGVLVDSDPQDRLHDIHIPYGGRVGLDADGVLYLAVAANEGGAYFSQEWVSLPAVRAVLAAYLDSGDPFATRALKGAYRSRSVNNAGFLAAILRHEGLTRAGVQPHLHLCQDGWDAWEARERARPGGTETPDAASDGATEPAEPDADVQKDAPGGRRARRGPGGGEESDNAGA
jgi:hypothetical protein